MIDKTKITGLKVSVAMASTDHHKDPSKFSEWGDYKILYDITAGFDAGLAPEDDLFPDVPALTMDGMGLADLLPKMPGKTETKGGAQGGKGGSKTVTAKISGEITIELSDGTVDLSGLTIKL